jgi:hypothetical protein
MRRNLFFATIAAAATACASALPSPPAPLPTAAAPAPSSPAVTPAAALADHEGDSPETAVTVPAGAPNEGIDFQNNWIFDRYGRFRRVGGGIAHAGEGSATRRYEVVKFEVPDHSEHTVYFDITENEKTWTHAPPQPQPH